jgi:hypothetical protein
MMKGRMQSQKRTMLIALGILSLWVFVAGSAHARATRFEAIGVACETFDGNGDRNRAGFNLSDEPRIAGRAEVEVTFVGQQVLIHAVYFPDAFPGSTWQIEGHSTLTPAPAVHYGYGTGALEGQTIVFLVTEQLDLDDPPCDDPLNVVLIVGTIIDRPSR